ncbi:MAG: aldehyde dehydrogenase family protein [Sandaracinaceae bacterium]|nr:aldehyde dehydrogenase family protein [Sandaracinaceae bacterium]
MTTLLPTFPTHDEIPEAARIDTSSFERTWLVNGEVRRWQGPTQEVRSPVCLRRADGTHERALVGHLAALDEAAAREALGAARRAWDDGRGTWPSMRVGERIARTERFVEGMKKVRETVVRLLMWEIGKTRKDAETEFDRTVQYIDDTLEALKELDRTSGRFVVQEGFLAQIRRSPLGTVLCMGPFNYPLNETFTTLVPALVMGNTIVSKLPRYGALLHLPLLEAFAEAFPPGVVNVVSGDGPTVVGPMMSSGQIDCLAFIGTSRVANLLTTQHPKPNRLRTITGLEAKNPAIILPDADLDVAVAECVGGALTFNGQRCTALKQIFVHRDVADAFVPRFAEAVDALPAGMPWTSGAKLTPLPEDGKCARLAELVADAESHGAVKVNRGGVAHETFYRPAVLHHVSPRARLYTEEQFGPIVPIATFDRDEEIDAFMRASSYGQQVALFGRDPKRMAGLVDALVNQVSRINLNTQCRRGPDTFPFTGRKDSAEGTLSVSDALRAFSIRAVVAATTNEANEKLVTDVVTGRLSSFLSTDFVF